MRDIQSILIERFSQAIRSAFGEAFAKADPLIQVSTNLKFGDYQANVAMGLAKSVSQKPRQVAQAIVDQLDVREFCHQVQIAGPGFINLTLKSAFLVKQLAHLVAAKSDAPDTAQADAPQTIVIDYSGPNVAKEMHIGHLRSTVIGDCLARVLTYIGHTVLRQNHLGDWGTQFGMLIELLIEQEWDKHPVDQHQRTIADLDDFYRQAKKKFDEDADFASRARQRVVKLQSADERSKNMWQYLIEHSMLHFNEIYRRLDVLLTDEDICGESFYNDQLASVIGELDKTGLLAQSNGAKVVYAEGLTDRDGNQLAMIVRKSDGGYLYATTDLAAVRYRIEKHGADRIIYVTDVRQAQHFSMVFATAAKAGWAGEKVRLEHVSFGTILGADRRPFKTREGNTVKLADVLNEAEQRAAAVIGQKSPDLPPEERAVIARTVGIGALKYGDLANDRIKDYVFDWNRMLALDGNTSPYLQNAYVRIRSIFRKGEVDVASLDTASLSVNEPAERALAVKLLQMPAVIVTVADSLEPHRLCTYLYELASLFHHFYEKCPVLAPVSTADDTATRQGRLVLCYQVARTLKQGLALLGIGVVEHM